MDWLQQFTNDQTLQNTLFTFLDTYGTEGLCSALQQYAAQQQTYVCRTRGNIFKINIYDICYLQISGHTISIHTTQGIYQKYGSLRQEIEKLSPYGFIQCSQSCIVSTQKIVDVQNNEIILEDQTRLHISRTNVRKVLMKYTLR